MGTMSAYTLQDHELEEIADRIKVAVVNAMGLDNLLDINEANKWCLTHTVMIRKPGLLFRTFAKLTGKPCDDEYSRIIIVGIHEEDSDELGHIKKESDDEG